MGAYGQEDGDCPSRISPFPFRIGQTPTMASHLIGIDVGTSSTKAVLINETGDVIATAAPEYEFRTPKPLWAESDPADWWTATLKAIPAVLEEAGIGGTDVAGIGLTGQMHGLVMLDAAGAVIRPCIMWNDQRTAAECRELTTRIGAETVLEVTGNPLLTGFTAPKIAWVAKHEPEAFSRCAKILLPKDYIRYRLSGEFFTDVADASGMSLLDVGKRTWSDTMLEGVGADRSWLAEVTESPVASTRLSAEAARLTGLVEGTPIAAGGGDQAAQAVGCGIVEEGVISATFGTSGVVFAHSAKYRVEPEGRLHAFCSAVPGEWHLMGVMLSAAGSFQWFRNALGSMELYAEKHFGIESYDLLTRSAAQAPAGCEGLLFLPYLSGERTPHPDPDARGVFFGLTLRHGKPAMARAVLEGVTYGMRDSLELMRNLGIESNRVVASGGGSNSAFWRQMMADMFETPITLVNATEGAAYGAALLGGVGAGLFPDVGAACRTCIRTTEEVEPGPEAAVYNDFYPRYQALYPALKDEFAALAPVVQKHLEG